MFPERAYAHWCYEILTEPKRTGVTARSEYKHTQLGNSQPNFIPRYTWLYSQSQKQEHPYVSVEANVEWSCASMAVSTYRNTHIGTPWKSFSIGSERLLSRYHPFNLLTRSDFAYRWIVAWSKIQSYQFSYLTSGVQLHHCQVHYLYRSLNMICVFNMMIPTEDWTWYAYLIWWYISRMDCLYISRYSCLYFPQPAPWQWQLFLSWKFESGVQLKITFRNSVSYPKTVSPSLRLLRCFSICQRMLYKVMNT